MPVLAGLVTRGAFERLDWRPADGTGCTGRGAATLRGPSVDCGLGLLCAMDGESCRGGGETT